MRLYPALEVTWPVRPDEDVIDRLVALLDDHQPTGVEEQPRGVRVFFQTPAHRDRARLHLQTIAPEATAAAVEVSDDDWAARSQAAITSIAVDRLVVSPPWDVQAIAGVQTIVIQPSMGFGTGHHASTRLCLRLLQQIAPLDGHSVIDVGTGSGVLAIAASKLGASRVVAIDSDPDAVTSARENLELNDAIDRVDLRRHDVAGTAATGGTPFDLVLANLTGAVLIRHARTLCDLAAVGGSLILSGIEPHETDDVIAAFTPLGPQVIARDSEQGWIGLRLDRAG